MAYAKSNGYVPDDATLPYCRRAGSLAAWQKSAPYERFFLVFVCLCVSPLQGRSNGGISVYTLCPKKGSHQTLGSNFVKS